MLSLRLLYVLSALIALVAVAVMVGGCALFALTPAQERTFAVGNICSAEVPGYRLTRVLPDGRYYWLGSEAGGRTRWEQCMAREFGRLRREAGR